jgi:nucleoside-diphosphate-sugar epimerase
MRILITGTAGFIGSNLAQGCIDRGWEVVGVDDMSNGHVDFVPRSVHDFMRCDFVFDGVINRIINKEFDVVFHLAARPRVSFSVEKPLFTHVENVHKTIGLIEACRGNVKRFVFSSSSSVYGGAKRLPTPEDEPFNPQSPYALHKAIVEQYLRLYAMLYGMDSVCLRYFNVFGKNQFGDSPYATAVSAWLTAIRQGRPLRSDGTGEQSRDMCHVDNVVRANILAAEHRGKLNGTAINVACGDRVTNNEILAHLQKKHPNIVVKHANWRPGDVMHTQADIAKGYQLIGYEPVVRFWDGLERTELWYEQSPIVEKYLRNIEEK